MNNVNQLSEATEVFEEKYMNVMQIKGIAIDANITIAKVARAAGKTVFFAGRMQRVAQDLPGQTSVLMNKTYVSLLSNIIPNLRAEFNKPVGIDQKPMWEEGVDYVLGTSQIPKHFKKPLRPPVYPKHAMTTSHGHVFQLAASDQPESVAGQSFVHAFIEELKHNKGEKLKTRLFPSIRGSIGAARQSAYFEGITGVSDAARVDLGEDNWFEEYEKIMDNDLINEIWTVFKHVNDLTVDLEMNQFNSRNVTDKKTLGTIQIKIDKLIKTLRIWKPRLAMMRQAATYFITASTFVNKDFLGVKFFKTQLDSMPIEDFLVAICNITQKRVQNMFFIGYNHNIHGFDDTYKYNSILSIDLKDTFTVTADLLKYFDPSLPLILGYDPGFFSSIITCQHNRPKNEFRALKEFYYYHKLPQGELARQIWAFYGPYLKHKKIILYYDRAGNKRRSVQDLITTDARLMKAELEKYGFKVEMKNEKQRTIFYYEHYKLLEMLFSNMLKTMPKILVDLNECKNLNSSIYMSPVKKDDGKIEMDKSSERKVAWQYQAGLTTQLSSAFMYVLFGMFNDRLPKEMKRKINLTESITL